MARRKSTDTPETAKPGRRSPSGPRPRPPAAGVGLPRPSNAVIDARVAMIAKALTDGLTRSAIIETIAREQRDEVVARGKATASAAQREETADSVHPSADKTEQGEQNSPIVPLVWGDKPVPSRTVDHYIAKARRTILTELNEGMRSPRAVRSMQVARLSNVYEKAVANEHFGAALRASERLARILRRPYGFLSPARARFARLVVAGKPLAEAFALSHPARVKRRSRRALEGEAHRLMLIPSVVLKVAELRERAEQHAIVTYESHVKRLGEIRDAAFDAGQYAAATSAEVARAKASGLLVDEMNINVRGVVATAETTTTDLSRLSIEELAQLEGLLAKAQSDQTGVLGAPPPSPGLARIAAASSNGNGNETHSENGHHNGSAA